MLEVNKISDLQAGIAAEYLVCADLIIKGFGAYKTEQGMKYDVVLDVNGRLYKIQVKSTRQPSIIKARADKTPFYKFSIGKNGKNARRKKYDDGDIDIFAIVALDTKEIAYINAKRVRAQMNFKVTKYCGLYHNEQGIKSRIEAIKLFCEGLTHIQIAMALNRTKTMINHYLNSPGHVTNIHGRQSGYLTDYKINDAL